MLVLALMAATPREVFNSTTEQNAGAVVAGAAYASTFSPSSCLTCLSLEAVAEATSPDGAQRRAEMLGDICCSKKMAASKLKVHPITPDCHVDGESGDILSLSRR